MYMDLDHSGILQLGIWINNTVVGKSKAYGEQMEMELFVPVDK